VLGLNGSGKSTLLKIMAGVDTEFDGEARPMPDLNIGYLPQEPQLDPTKTVREVVEEAVSVIKDAQARLDEVYAAYAEPDADFDKLAAEQAKLEAILQASDGHNLERQLEVAADALRLPAWDAKSNTCPVVKSAAWPCAACCCPPRHAAARRTDQPPGRRFRRLAGALPARLPGTVVAITHDRYFLDNVAGWILELDRGAAFLTRATTRAGWKPSPTVWPQESKQQSAHEKAMKEELEWVRKGAKARQSKSKARLQRFEEMQSQEFQKRSETNEIYIPAGPRLGDKVIEFKNVTKGYGDRVLIDNLSFSMPKAPSSA
jgi:ATPase subunit of ABC transporter with duplicated ATPase domains